VGSDASLKMKSMSVEIWNGKKQRIGLKLVGKSMSGQNEVINSMTLFYGIYRTEMLTTITSHFVIYS